VPAKIQKITTLYICSNFKDKDEYDETTDKELIMMLIKENIELNNKAKQLKEQMRVL